MEQYNERIGVGRGRGMIARWKYERVASKQIRSEDLKKQEWVEEEASDMVLRKTKKGITLKM